MLKEIDLALTSHGLIKVRAGGDDREAREAMLSTICDTLSCAPVHHLGKILILFRPLAGNIKPASLAALEPERPAKRRASEPHTPKKLAAEGKTLAKRPRRSETEEPKPKTRFVPADQLNKNGKPMRPSTKKASGSGHGIPRRAGSVLSACGPEPAAAPAAGRNKKIRRQYCPHAAPAACWPQGAGNSKP